MDVTGPGKARTWIQRELSSSSTLCEENVVVVVVDPKLLSSSLLYSQCQADEGACLLQLVSLSIEGAVYGGVGREKFHSLRL